jgi:hypothetical protein
MRSYPRWIWVAGLLLAPAVLYAGPPSSYNQRMADKIADVLQTKGDFGGCRIMIEYVGGVATLKGTVNTPWQRYEALQLTEGIRGIRDVVDGLAILPDAASSLANRASAPPPAPAPPPIKQVAVPPTQPVAALAQRPQQVQPARGWYMQEEAAPAPMPQQSPAMMAEYARPTVAPVRYDLPHFPPYAWPSYASYPNYASLTYPQQYSPTAWPYIGPFYPYPQVPLGWRKVTLEWDDGWWFLKFKD